LSLGLIGKKSGMSRVFQEDGDSIPVSIVSVFGNYAMSQVSKRKNLTVTTLFLSQKLKTKKIALNHKKSFSLK